MANARVQVIDALRQAARNISAGMPYQWGHMGSCNCGHLAQVITSRSKAEIHRQAMRSHGDWSEQLTDYCATSGLPFDHIIDEMLNFGFKESDLCHLEKLSDPAVLQCLPPEKRHLRYNLREDAVLYLKTWANHLEDSLISGIEIDEVKDKPAAQLV
ncbi:MAG: hypothetical protein INR69_16740 [Mucilaginibacter polytrichastri]|nr:hypothetical protein [Mucilaginibacter polytrichastri]